MEDLEDAEYPGVRWVLASYILLFLEDAKPMPRCQDLPRKAFGSLRSATRVLAVTHPWLGRWHPDPHGIQVETLRAKLQKMKTQLMLDEEDVVFIDYMSLPQVSPSGVDDRTPADKARLAAALSGDLMGRVYLTSRVIIIDEVPVDAECNVPYLARGWCYFECMVASMNTFPRDLAWVTKEVKGLIADFRGLAAGFRETGDLRPLLQAFDGELGSKVFAAASDRELVRGFFASLATSQRLVAAAARGDVSGVVAALEDGADPCSRNGQGRTALHAACANNHVEVVLEILRRTGAAVVTMKTMENETCCDLAEESGARECLLLLKHKLGEVLPAPLIVPSIKGDVDVVKALLRRGGSLSSTMPAAAVLLPAAATTVPRKDDAGVAVDAASKGAAQLATLAWGPERPVTASASGSPLATAAVSGQPPPAKAAGSATAGKSGPVAAKGKAVALTRGVAMRSVGRLVVEPAPAASATVGAAKAGTVSRAESPAAAHSGLRSSGTTFAAPASTPKRAPTFTVPAAEAQVLPPSVLRSRDVGPVAIDAADDIGNTALHYAVSLGRVLVAEVLISARADPNVANGEGETPIAMARRMDRKQILDLLRPAT